MIIITRNHLAELACTLIMGQTSGKTETKAIIGQLVLPHAWNGEIGGNNSRRMGLIAMRF